MGCVCGKVYVISYAYTFHEIIECDGVRIVVIIYMDVKITYQE